MTKVQLEPAYLLHRRPYQETSALIEILSASHGRLPLVARGVRRRGNRLASLLQPFVPMLLSWSRRGEVGTLLDVEQQPETVGLKGRALLSGFYVNELLIRLVHRDDPHPQVFDVYTTVLHRLQQSGDEESALRTFEKRLLQLLGYALILDREADSDTPVQADAMYTYVPEAGPRKAVASSTTDPHRSWRGSTLLALHHDRWTDLADARDGKRFMRAVLAPHLGGRPLISRTLFRGSAAR